MSSRASSRDGSQCSKASSKSSVRRYRKIADNSEVDELLFGPSTPTRQHASNDRDAATRETLHFTAGGKAPLPHPHKINPKSRQPETLRVITKDLIRDVVVPADDTQSRKAVISRDTFDLLSWKAHAKEHSEQELKKTYDKERNENITEMTKRKAVLNAYDQKRKENKPLNEFEQEMNTLAEGFQRRYEAQRLEENDEIRHLKELILEAKCHAIRDAQVHEKHKLRTELCQENDRLDALMELDRIQAIQQQEENVKRRKEQRQRGARLIMEQIETNAAEKLLEGDRKDAEARMMVDNQQKLQMQDLAEIERKKIQQKELQTEIDAIKEANRLQKLTHAEMSRIAEQRVVAYEEAKKIREELEVKRVLEARCEKDLEIAKLRAAQEKASDLQAERDALRAKRHEEHTEREYRRKMREEVVKKVIIDDEMARAREDQISAKRHLMAVQAARERAEFDKQLLEQKKEVQRIVELNKERQSNLKAYSNDVRNQIGEREATRIKERKAFFDETIAMDKEIEEKNRKLVDVKKDKLRKLKDSGVPEKYVHEVARRIGLTSLD